MARIRTLQLGMWSAPERLGGADRYFYSLLPQLPEQGVDPHGLVVGDAAYTASIPFCEAFARDDDSLVERWKKMRAVGRPLIEGSDLIVTHFAPYQLSLVDRLRRKPLVVHFHGPWALEGAAEGAGALATFVKKQIETLVYRRGARFIMLSRAFADLAIREYGVPADRVRIVPGGVDVERFTLPISRRDAREHLGWPTDRPLVVTVRRLVRAKGVDHLIEAASALRERIANIGIVIVGTGPLAAELQQSIVDRGLQDTVRLAGHASEADLPYIYRAADLFVVPTVTLEGFGLVVVEALAAGTPTLVTPIGGLPDVVRALDPNLVLSGYAPHALARGIGDALADPSRLPSERACADYANGFRWSEVARRVADVYREIA
jgi:glycosyltransferase involved in cell wall biosynthesis